MQSPNPCILAPSILAGNHARLAESLHAITSSGTPWVHLDIMDGHFVPNLTFGPETVKCLKQESPPTLFYDVHLMLDNPQSFVEAFADAGADLISIHVEPENLDIEATLDQIIARGCQSGIVLNPATPVEAVKPYLARVDLVLIMTVQPGFGGQSFQHRCLDKISQLHQWREDANHDFRIEVDGGIDTETGPLCREEGADTFVAGTAFFKAEDRREFMRRLTV